VLEKSINLHCHPCGGRDPDKMKKSYYVYILASKRNGTLYVGVTNDLIRRIIEHKNEQQDGFTKKYNVILLVYYEETSDIDAAITREKQLKKWKRAWKIRLIERSNPEWRDLFQDIMGEEISPGFPPARE
jgi:putative endonuclease